MQLRRVVRTFFVVVPLLVGSPAAGQSQPEGAAAAARVTEPAPWQPLGPLPIDQAGGGLRGYALPAEDADVAEPGSDRISFHVVSANNFYREQTGDFLISQRYETHTLALGFRRGFDIGFLPRLEFGGQIQLSERDSGFMNGFIAGFENLWASLVGGQSANIQMRKNLATAPPLGVVVSDGSRSIYRGAATGGGFGDLSLAAKALVHGGSVPTATRVAARLVVNVSGKSEFTAGNFTGIGISIDQRMSDWAVLHADVRTTVFLDRISAWDLPLKRGSIGFSVGPELKLARNTSFSLQYDANTSPYLPTGTAAFDNGYGALSFGVAHRFSIAGHELVSHVYARENMNLPIRVSWNTDPDLALGIKTTIRFGAR